MYGNVRPQARASASSMRAALGIGSRAGGYGGTGGG